MRAQMTSTHPILIANCVNPIHHRRQLRSSEDGLAPRQKQSGGPDQVHQRRPKRKNIDFQHANPCWHVFPQTFKGQHGFLTTAKPSKMETTQTQEILDFLFFHDNNRRPNTQDFMNIFFTTRAGRPYFTPKVGMAGFARSNRRA